MPPNHDNYLWEMLVNGDMEAFQSLYNLHYHKLNSYGLRIVRDNELVKDAIHDLFVKLWTNKKNLSTPTNVLSYLLQSLRFTIYNKLERENKYLHADHDFEEYMGEENNEALLQKINRADWGNHIHSLLHHLTPRQREFIHLYFLEDFGYEEVAQILGLSVKATYKLSARAVSELRRLLLQNQSV